MNFRSDIHIHISFYLLLDYHRLVLRNNDRVFFPNLILNMSYFLYAQTLDIILGHTPMK